MPTKVRGNPRAPASAHVVAHVVAALPNVRLRRVRRMREWRLYRRPFLRHAFGHRRRQRATPM